MSYPETYDLDGDPIARLAAGTVIRSSQQVTDLQHAFLVAGRTLTAEESAAVLAGRIPTSLLAAAGSALPTRGGFYWWREDDRSEWRVVKVADYGDGNHLTGDVSFGKWSGRSLNAWRESFPVGEWVEILSPDAERTDHHER